MTIRFSVVRYGNVMGTRGSVIPFFLQKAKTGVLPITDPAMTRFNITLQEGVDLGPRLPEPACGAARLFVPKIPSYRIHRRGQGDRPRREKPRSSASDRARSSTRR